MTVHWKTFTKQEGIILYNTSIKVSNSIRVRIPMEDGTCKTIRRPRMYYIKHEDLTLYNFDRGFLEFVMDNVDNVRLYFDFDKIASEEEYISAIQWLDNIATVFGPYSIGGYSGNKDFAEKYGYKYYEGNQHFLSAHVVFFTAKLSKEDIMKIMRYNTKLGYTAYDIHPACDPYVYKLTTRQCFRHVMSDKLYNRCNPRKEGKEESDWFSTIHSTENVINHGNILNNMPPDTQVITPKGTEKLITKEEWSKVFHSVDGICVQTKSPALYSKIVSILQSNDTNEPMLFTKAEMVEFLSYFEPNFHSLLRTLRSLRRSPYSIEFLFDTMYEWYSTTKHVQPAAESIAGILDSYYVYEKSNNWLRYMLPYINIHIQGFDNDNIEKEYGSVPIDDVIKLDKKIKQQTKPNNKRIALKHAIKLGLIEDEPKYNETDEKDNDYSN